MAMAAACVLAAAALVEVDSVSASASAFAAAAMVVADLAAASYLRERKKNANFTVGQVHAIWPVREAFGLNNGISSIPGIACDSAHEYLRRRIPMRSIFRNFFQKLRHLTSRNGGSSE